MHPTQLLLASALLALPLAPVHATPHASTSPPACAGIHVLNACTTSTTAITQSCASSDYNCLCQKWTDVLTCYNECPSDSGLSDVKSRTEAYCASAAAADPSSRSAVAVAQAPSTAVSESMTVLTGTGSAAAATKSGATSAVNSNTASRTAESSSASRRASTTFGAAGTSATASATAQKNGGARMAGGEGVGGVEGVVLGFVAGVLGVVL